MTRRFGPYLLERELAQGGQGSVWKARHEATGQEVALKLLTQGGESAALRFAQEARVLARLCHPNVVGVLDHGEHEGTAFLACELVAGEDLQARARRGPPHPAWIAQVLIAVARALQHCHERGVVHRDVKPQNVLVETQGERPVLVDFGLVKRDPAQLGITSIDDRGELSLSGSLKGTPEYMAPEQVHPRHGAIGPATDVYGLGATLFFLLTGQPPFSAESLPALLRKVTRQPPPDPAQLDPARVPQALARVCLHAMAKDPRARYPTAEAFAQALRATGLVSDGSDPRRTSSGRLLAGLQAPARAGQRLGPFTIVRELGRGAMGVVFEGRADDGREVAIKLLSGKLDERLTRRFEREVKALSALQHPHVVRFAGASSEGTPWLAMELVKGRDLQALLERDGKPAWEDTARLVAQVARGVAHAHAREVMHRDLKPSNVLVREDGQALVTDFGLARSLEASRFTRTGDAVGTLAYMAPEQVKGQRQEGTPADVWGIGAILFRCLTGEPPFAAESALGLAVQICEGAVRRPRSLAADVPADLEAVCLACLQVDPAARPTAEEVADALEARRPLGSLPATGRGARVAALGAAALLVSVAVGLALARQQPAAVAGGGAGPATTVAGEAPPWRTATDPAPAWALGAGAAPEAPHPGLWDEPGRVAAPVARVLAGRPEALAAAFLGEARASGDGRVSVRYADPGRALRYEASDPGTYIIATAPTADLLGVSALSAQGDAATARVDNDANGASVWVGRAHWDRARVSMRAWLQTPVNRDQLVVRVGALPPGVSSALRIDGRERRTQASPWGRTPSVPVHLTGEPVEVVYEPGARGGRDEVLRVGDEVRREVQGVLVPAPGPVRLELMEAHVGLDRLEVTGRPVRTDVPALAVAPLALTVNARVAAAFTTEAQGEELAGGPLLALVDATGAPALALELERARLVLRLRDAAVAVAEVRGRLAGSTRAWLSLERRGDVAVGTLGGDGGEDVRVTAPVPLPFGGPLRAAWGSGAARVTFEAVEAHVGPEDADRARWDAEALELQGSARALWRTGALRAARVTDARVAPLELQGPGPTARRRAAARGAAEALEKAAARFAGDPDAGTPTSKLLRQDALARALLSWIAAADAREAARVAEALVGPEGRAALDGLERTPDGAPRLVARLVEGWCGVQDIAVQLAALRAAAVLLPEQDVAIQINVGGALRTRRFQVPEEEAAEATREAFSLFQRARAGLARATLPPEEAARLSLKLDGHEGDALLDVGRYAEALERWERVAAARPELAYAWQRRAECLEGLGRVPEALEAYLGYLAYTPGMAKVWDRVVRGLVPPLIESGRHRGLAATCLVLASEVARVPGLEAQARELARLAAEDLRDAHLSAYVLTRWDKGRGPPDAPWGGDTELLARARLGDPTAREALVAATRREPLVRHIALLDPLLAPLVR